MDENDYAMLRSLRLAIADQLVSGVFVPYVGEHYANADHRIMYIGKATNGWGDHSAAIEAQQSAAEFVLTKVATNEHSSGFWHYLFELAATVHEQPEENRDWLLTRVVWSNLFKVGLEIGPPIGNSAVLQRDFCIRALNQELELLKPNFVAIVTGGYEEGVVTSVFGEDGWTKLNSDVWTKTDHPNNRAVLYTRHPERWASGSRTNAISAGLDAYKELRTHSA